MGIVAAVAIPRISQGSNSAAESALVKDLSVLRNAIDMYAGEHNGAFPADATVEEQLTMYTDISGATSATKTATHIYGPYLRKSPPLPIGDRKGRTKIASGGGNVGWKYDPANGDIRANTKNSEKDADGKKYKHY